ncbi:peptidoglycan-associated lipoprotein Pal [Ramlibacter sp. USB13]|uniref:Peptidoglycan-associated lipoprotein n=1 Tax=Ramlibacter cellulosilyticus TaxID=2764187 RepID=A0A923MUD4_9BURK|nr:peptidoglycan-associated lipoprotein Pal [Ramlibacter cellulosilyticus]MBC5785340.1 peptidoglycan-associated lipoprotein Pal [Ramlibacter cellulosilyticus]
MKQSLLLAAAFAAALAGCASGVKLDDVPVEDRAGRTGAAVTPGAGGQTQVQPVQADTAASSQAGPVNVARVIYFDYDSYVIKPEFQRAIEAHAQFLKQNGARHVVIEGHTDERGGREYNLALGQKRSEAVRRALELLGVRDAQVEAVSFGKEKPAAQGADETAWAQNRRAEIAYR